jgi:hypothetical protein
MKKACLSGFLAAAAILAGVTTLPNEGRGASSPCGDAPAKLCTVEEQAAQRTAYVAELADPRESGRFLARFDAHWETNRDPAIWEQGPEDASLDEALAWARERAAVVYVTLGDEAPYSAGAQHNRAFRRWPESGIIVRPRPAGSPYDGSKQIVGWPLRSVVIADDPARVADQLRERLAADSPLTNIVISVLKADEMQVECELQARGAGAAFIEADRLLTAAIARIDPSATVLKTGVRYSRGE